MALTVAAVCGDENELSLRGDGSWGHEGRRYGGVEAEAGGTNDFQWPDTQTDPSQLYRLLLPRLALLSSFSHLGASD